MHHALAALKAAIAVAGRRARNRLPDEGQATEEHQKDDCNDKPMTDRHATPISVDPAQQRPFGSISPSSLQ